MYQIIEENIKRNEQFNELSKNTKHSYSIFGAADSIKPFFLACLQDEIEVPIIFVCKNAKQAKEYFSKSYNENDCYFPPKDMEFQRFDAKSREEENLRVSTLKNLLDKKCGVVYTSCDALLSKLCPSEVFESGIFEIEKGKNYDISKLFAKCIELGYMRESLVEGEGAVAKRGSILDIYIPSEHAYRIDFFDDEVESIKIFDPVSQRTLGQEVKCITVSSASEFVIDKKKIESASKRIALDIADNSDSDFLYELDLIKQNTSFDGMDKYFYAFYKGNTIFDYAKKCVVVFDSLDFVKKEAEIFYEEFKHDYLEYLKASKALPGQIENLFEIENIVEESFNNVCYEFSSIKPSENFKKAKTLEFSYKNPISYKGNLKYVADDVKTRIANDHCVYLYVGDEKNKRVLTRFFDGRKIDLNKVHILDYPLADGVEFSYNNCLVLGERNIFGFAKQKKQQQADDNTLDFTTDLTEGDVVVHEFHGRGRYLGLKTMEVQGKRRDYLHLEYKDGDKLYIPTEQINRIQKYIGGENLTLSKLGGKEWKDTKNRVSKSVKKLAFDLVSIYSERTLNKGFEYMEDNDWQEDFEAAFPHQETDGQLKCISEIKADMQSKKVMDRLLLGDVGFGKTEVAMRACFKAACNQKQVAVLAPTTLLARQHYENFTERFKDFPVKICQLSRFVTPTNRKKNIEAMQQGNMDIIIGTHALLSDKIKFKDLGLLVVDEEQRFGVAHKEKIKNLKKNVDVLTLSATPIPRTLEMSLIGIRDMSMLKTPPTERKKIKTYVLEYSRSVLSRAISREMERGGQCYVVCTRVKQIDYLLKEIKTCVPQAKVTYVHGQLAEREIETKMDDFCANKYDVLVATTIIESGLDIPNCNTLVVYQADKYGLSQLYQIKGRIGRSDRKAVCYLTYIKDEFLSTDARKRLDAIKQNTDFGAGFKIAMKDLEIRGAGNLLGGEQSGHMDKVGYDMYCKLMKKAVSEAKGKIVEEPVECSVELKIDAYIPADYIDDEMVKIEAYKMISSVSNTKQAKAVSDELVDRFGALPLCVKNLITTALVKSFAQECGLALVARLGDSFNLKYAKETRVNFAKLLEVLDEYKRDAKLNPTDPPTLILSPKRSAIKELFTFLNSISRCKI